MPTTHWRQTCIAVLALGVAIVLIHPVAEVGMNDDWSFIRTAYDLAASGHFRYNGWAAPLIGFQAYWGALFFRLFGYSFTIARLSTALLTLLFIPVLLRLFRVAGVNATASLFATLTLVLSPLLLPSLTSFMTDTPAFLFFAGSLLASLEAWKAPEQRNALLWTVLAMLLGTLSGSIRQIYWAAAVWFLAVLAVRRFKTISERATVALCIVAALGFALAASHWQSLQPYVSAGSSTAALTLPWNESLGAGINYLLRFVVTWCVLLLPVTLAFARLKTTWVVLPVAVLAGWLVFKLGQPLPWVGNTLTENGVLSSYLDAAGDKPVVLAPFAIWLIATTGVAAAFQALRNSAPLPNATLRFAVMTLPFLAVYLAVIILRGPVYGVYDRYAIPVIAILATLVLSAYQPKRIPIAAWIALCVYALYGIATTHDSFSGARARLAAATRLLSTGAKRSEILAGFEFECWTQTAKSGYINNDQIKIPPSAYHNAEDCNGSDDVQLWWRSLAPDVRANYVITLTPLPALEPPVVTEPYQTWLPFGTHYAYAQRSKTTLMCKPE